AVEDAFARTKKDSLPRPPFFRRFDGGGKLQVQMQAGTTVAELLAGTSRATLRRGVKDDPKRRGTPPWRASIAQDVPRGERRQIALTVNVHREPPLDATVKWVAIVVRRVGMRTSYELQLTL